MGVTLQALNAIERDMTMGGVVFVSALMVIGVVGNIHVLFVYLFKTAESSRRTFIVVLGVLDFVASSVGMPFIVVDLMNPLNFDIPAGCKILRFVNYFVSTSTTVILLVIAVDRYRKVCKPLSWQISKTSAKYLCLGFTLVSGALSWPAAILFGSNDMETSHPNVTGVSCSIVTKYENTRFPFLFNAMLLCVVFIIGACLIVLYCLIGKTIANFKLSSLPVSRDQHSGNMNMIQKHFGRASTNEASSTSTITRIGDDNESETETVVYHVTDMSSFSSTDSNRMDGPSIRNKTGIYVIGNVNHNTDSRNKNNTDVKKRDSEKKHRTTLMFCLITIVYILSYFPHLILKIVVFTKPDFMASMSDTGRVLYNTFIWCFYINNVSNALIYWCFDKKFRNEIKICYWEFVCGCCRMFR